MKKINNKGFGLVETLITTIFVMTIVSLVFVNFYPLIGEYSKREVYDDIDGKYAAYWIKTLIEDEKFVPTLNNNYFEFSCDNLSSRRSLCYSLKSKLNIDKIYITSCNISLFKSSISKNQGFSDGFLEYVNYLPEFSKKSCDLKYRVLLQMRRVKDGNGYDAYSTMEVSFND